MIKPIKRQDGSYVVEDLEIVAEIKKHSGKESLDVKDKKPEWYNMVKRQVKGNIDQIKIDLNNNKNSDDFENSDLTIDEVEMAVESTSNTSAPSPEEKIFTVFLSKMVVKGFCNACTFYFKNAGLLVNSSLLLNLTPKYCYQSLIRKTTILSNHIDQQH